LKNSVVGESPLQCFVTGHDFSRAARTEKELGFTPADLFFERGIMGLRPTEGDEKPLAL
jgi:hypothetical protein